MKDDSDITIREDKSKAEKATSQKDLVFSLILKINNESFRKSESLLIDTPKGIKIVDIRETRINGIRDLKTLLQPNFDEEMEKEKGEFDKKLKAIEKKLYISNIYSVASEKVSNITNYAERDKIFNEWFNWLLKVGYVSINKQTDEYNGYLEGKHNIYQELFEQLVYLLDRIEWLQAGELREEM